MFQPNFLAFGANHIISARRFPRQNFTQIPTKFVPKSNFNLKSFPVSLPISRRFRRRASIPWTAGRNRKHVWNQAIQVKTRKAARRSAYNEIRCVVGASLSTGDPAPSSLSLHLRTSLSLFASRLLAICATMRATKPGKLNQRISRIYRHEIPRVHRGCTSSPKPPPEYFSTARLSLPWKRTGSREKPLPRALPIFRPRNSLSLSLVACYPYLG